MSHAVEYITVEKRSEVMATAEEFAFYNVDRGENPCGSYHGQMTIHDKPICESYEEAEKFIDNHDNGFYDDHAVQYKDKSALKPTKQMENLKARMKKNAEDKNAYAEKHSVKNRKSEFAGCKKCGSKIATKYMRTDRCPVCGNDLRAEYVLERLEKYDDDYDEMRKKYAELEKKQKGKCPVRWLVKVEVHC